MAIRVKCQQCSSVVRVADKYAGLKVKCPACKEALLIPVATQGAGSSSPTDSAVPPKALQASKLPLSRGTPPLSPTAEAAGERSPGSERRPQERRANSHSVGVIHRILGQPVRIAVIAGAALVLCALLAGAWWFRLPTDWRVPARVTDDELGTTFLVELKDAWWMHEDERADGKEVFVIVYSCKNLGPREGTFSISRKVGADVLRALASGKGLPASPETNLEIKTEKGRIYAGFDLGEYWRVKGPKRDIGGWRPALTSKIDEAGESAFAFVITKGETPTELITPRSLGLHRKLPQGPFESKVFSEVFGFLPDAPEKAVPKLTKASHDGDRNIRRAAVAELAKLAVATKEAIPPLIEASADQDPNVRETATQSMQQLVTRPETASHVVAALIEVFHQPDIEHRIEAAKALARIGSAAKDAIEVLSHPQRAPWRSRNDGEKMELSTVAGQAIVAIGGADAVAALLRDSTIDAETRASAVTALGPRRSTSSDGHADPVGRRRGFQNASRRRSGGAWRPTVLAKDAVPVLIEALQSRDPEVCLAAARTLAELGPPGHAAIPALQDTVRGARDLLFVAALDAILEVGDVQTDLVPVIPALIQRLNAPSLYASDIAAANALGEIGPAAKEAIPALKDFHRRSYASQRHLDAAKGALEKIGGPAEVVRLYAESKDERTKALNARRRKSRDHIDAQSSWPLPQPKGPLSGTWRTDGGGVFRIDDEGEVSKPVSITLVPRDSGEVREFRGQLIRRDANQNSKSFEGTLHALFRRDSESKAYPIPVSATLDELGRLCLHCRDWPKFSTRGKRQSTKPLDLILTRQQGSSSILPRSIHNAPRRRRP